MRKLRILIGTALFLVISGPRSAAETILVLSSSDPENQAVAAGFKHYFTGSIREINLEGSDAQQRIVGEQLKGTPPSLAVVVGDLAAQMAQWYLPGVPLVYCGVSRAAKFSFNNPQVIGIYHEPNPLEQLKLVPGLFAGKTRVAMFYSPENVQINEKELTQKAGELGITLNFVTLGSIKEVPAKLRNTLPQTDLLWVFTDPVILSSHSIQYLVLEAVSAGVPIYCGDSSLGRRGATAAFIPDGEDAGKLAAKAATDLIHGTRRSKQEIVYPKGKLILNQKIASLLKVSFPASLLSQAQELIQ